MASLIPGYEYDIFISYRQKDNKHDGWVTEFVDNLKGELESTFKEEISVYFDINPHDGLLETHDVDASLKDKLKCLIFVPIISRTYCDPKSFAWGHEFKAFVEAASKDHFGLKVKLPGGNIASRVLPVRIHDLDASDIRECELVLGGVLRGIDFIYKESGIDKPLAPEDDEKKNLNNTKYRIQIIKVAHAIREIILGMKTEHSNGVKEKDPPGEPVKDLRVGEEKIAMERPAKSGIWKLLSLAGVLVFMIFATILLSPVIFKNNNLGNLRSSGKKISIVVMPFQNMTNDTTWNVWQDGIQNLLITSLTNSEGLKVLQTETINGLLKSKGLINYASITPSIASIISQKLDANVFIFGSINQSGVTIRINSQLTDSKTGEVIKSFQNEGPSGKDMIFNIIDSLAMKVNNFLVISKLKMENINLQELVFTKSPDAYRYFIYGQSAFAKRDYPSAINMFTQAIAIDSNYTYSELHIAWAYLNQGLYEEGKKWCLKVYEKRNNMSIQQRLYTNFVYAVCFETPHERIKYLKQLLEIDNKLPHAYFDLGTSYLHLNQYDKAITVYEKSLEIYKEWGSKPWFVPNYTALGSAYHKTGQYKKEKELYFKAEQDFPDDYLLIYRQAVLSLTERDTITASKYIEKYISNQRDNSVSEAAITTNLAGIYSEAGILDKAEAYYQSALSLEPENSDRLNNLTYFLIDKDININKGLELIDKALNINPDNYSYLHTKGWGLYKLGKYHEALNLLQKSWELRMKNAVYDHNAFLHLEAAKKSVTGLK
jgi:tetratricopeptide (TPR) repeat protein